MAGGAGDAGASADGAAAVLEGVGKRFGGRDALQAIDARIAYGRLTGLVGPDGAGKTTLMRLLAGLLEPDHGRVRVAGQAPAVARDQAAGIGYMPQRFGLYEDLSVSDNLRLYARLRGLSRRDDGATFARLLEFTRLAPFSQRLAGHLSGGMKQKLGLACALMGRPRLLLLDEPSVGVDPVSRRDLWRMVESLIDQGMAVVWSTAYLDEAERCAQVLLLHAGTLAYAGPPGDLTATLAGRCFQLVHPARPRRELLAEVLDLDGVSDAVTAGEGVRAVLRAHAALDGLVALAGRAGARLEPVAPRFEDAFVDLLGGAPGGHSAIAERMPPIAPEPAAPVACEALTRRFGDFVAAHEVSFAVRQGEIFGLLGPNGAGKSTTFKMLCGLLRPSAGRAMVTGLDLRGAAAAAKRRIGYMAQKFSLYGLLSVQQNLEFSAGVYGLGGDDKRRRIEQMIDTFQLGPYLRAAPAELPLGFRQRLALACALMHRPAVLFLDEPTSGVDPLTRREFWTHINGLVARGVTVLVTTHFMDEAEYCDRVALMSGGRVIALDTPVALMRQAAADGAAVHGMEAAFIRLVETAAEHPAAAGGAAA
ncbi:MAG: ABC transporter ATP-binding protein [Gammaproteobacteria bacterium]|nr:ABC transporter ATP-binding protein [Gammaproteobacteria bacterium]